MRSAFLPLSYASLLTSLDAKPETVTIDGEEFHQVSTTTTDGQKLTVTLRCKPTSSCAKNFMAADKGALLIASGDLSLDDDGNVPIITLRSLCKGYEDQFLNEVSITGRLSGTIKEAEKSLSSSIAVNRFRGEEEVTDWFRVRCFGLNRDKLEDAPKGALVTASGILEQRTSAEKTPFVEVKTRVLRLHARPKGYDPSAGKEAAGYSQSDFEGDDAPPLPSDWS